MPVREEKIQARTELLAQKKFRLVKREMIDKVLHEQDFGAGGRVDPGTAAKIGKILGVKYIVIGRVTEFTIETKGGALGGVGLTVSTARVALDGRLVDTTTAEIVASVRGSGESKQAGLALSLKNLPFIAFGAKDFQESILGKATRAGFFYSVLFKLRQVIGLGREELRDHLLDLIHGQKGGGQRVKHDRLVDRVFVPGQRGLYRQFLNVDIRPVERGQLPRQIADVAGV